MNVDGYLYMHFRGFLLTHLSSYARPKPYASLRRHLYSPLWWRFDYLEDLGCLERVKQ